MSIFGELKTNSGTYIETNVFPKCNPYIRLISISISSKNRFYTFILDFSLNYFRRIIICWQGINYIGDVMKLIIGELIEEKGLKKRYIAKQIGINENTITNWINGKSYPRLDQAFKLAEILNCKIDDLYERNDKNE